MTDDPRLDDVCERALAEWGEDAQTTMVMEELAELIVDLSHYKRDRIGEAELANEMADVRICLRQLEMLVGERAYRIRLERTIDELDERLP